VTTPSLSFFRACHEEVVRIDLCRRLKKHAGVHVRAARWRVQRPCRVFERESSAIACSASCASQWVTFFANVSSSKRPFQVILPQLGLERRSVELGRLLELHLVRCAALHETGA